jgi:hypothetical protein
MVAKMPLLGGISRQGLPLSPALLPASNHQTSWKGANLYFVKLREQIVDRGIAKGERAMADLQKRLQHGKSEDASSDNGSSEEINAGIAAAHNSGQMSADAAEPEGTTPAMPQNKGIEPPALREEDVRNRKVDPESVRESFKDAELDPVAEAAPEEGEAAA